MKSEQLRILCYNQLPLILANLIRKGIHEMHG